MVEPVFRLKAPVGDVKPVVGETHFVDPIDAKHAISVRRIRVGERVALVDGKGLKLRGEVSKIADNEMAILVDEVLLSELPRLNLILIQALAKGDRDELAIQAATELGVSEVVPWQAERSISRWDESKALKGVARWQSIVTEAAKQSLRSFEPVVQPLATSKAIAQNIIDGRYGEFLVLDPSADKTLVSVLQKIENSAAKAKNFDAQTTITILVGPEGGIADTELDLFEAAGAHRVVLGREILRTSTAPLAAISCIQALIGEWRL